MRRVWLSVVLGALICSWTSTADGQVPIGDSVVGQGRTGPDGDLGFEQVFDFEANSGPSGEDPSGSVSLDLRIQAIPSNFAHLEGHVTCLSVSGNVAVMGFEVDFPPDSAITGVIIQAEDNGLPGSDPPDTFTSAPVDDPTSCVFPPIPLFDVVEGDVTVTDAPPLPTSKEHCKRGGWRAFDFENQGQCVAFVNRGEKP